MAKLHNPLEGESSELTLNLHNNSEEMVSIIIVHKDKPEYLNICLQSIAVASQNNNYEIIVVDNASGQESQDFLSEIEGEVKVVRNEKNLYWSGGCNRGVEAANKHSQYLIFLHADVVVLSSGWLDTLINVAEAQDSGLVGLEMSSYYMDGQQIDFIQEWCLLMSRECWNDCGPWAEELPMIGHSFIMTLKAQQRAYKPQVIKSSICHHYRVFGVDINVFEKFTDNASIKISKMIRDIQSIPVRSGV